MTPSFVLYYVSQRTEENYCVPRTYFEKCTVRYLSCRKFSNYIYYFSRLHSHSLLQWRSGEGGGIPSPRKFFPSCKIDHYIKTALMLLEIENDEKGIDTPPFPLPSQFRVRYATGSLCKNELLFYRRLWLPTGILSIRDRVSRLFPLSILIDLWFFHQLTRSVQKK